MTGNDCFGGQTAVVSVETDSPGVSRSIASSIVLDVLHRAILTTEKNDELSENNSNEDDDGRSEKLQNTASSNSSSCHKSGVRPDRKSKTSANALVALSLADERITDLTLFRLNNELKKAELSKLPNATNKQKNVKRTVKKVSKKAGKRQKPSKKKKKKCQPTMSQSGKPMSKKAVSPSPPKKPRKELSNRVSVVVDQVTTRERAFQCLKCLESFSSFRALSDHRVEVHLQRQLLNLPVEVQVEKWSGVEKRFESVSPSLSDFISDSVRSVPETVFNNMHGTINDLNSTHGKMWRSKPSMGTVDRVKLNVSGTWSMREVWEMTSWEVTNESLTWKRFEDDKKLFVQHLAQLSWPEQIKFKSCFERFINKRSDPSKTAYKPQTEISQKKTNLPQAIGLKQLGRSVKYMSMNERDSLNKRTKSKVRPKKR